MSDLTKCVCGHEIAYHSEDGCEAYVHPKIGGSGVCCTRTPEDIVRGLVQAAERERFPDRPRGDGTMSDLTEDERKALVDAMDTVVEKGWTGLTPGIMAPVIESIIAARTRAGKQERDALVEENERLRSWIRGAVEATELLKERQRAEAAERDRDAALRGWDNDRDLRDHWKARAEVEQQRVAELEAAVLALADPTGPPDGNNRVTSPLADALFNEWAEMADDIGDYEAGQRLADAAMGCIRRAVANRADPTALDRVRQEAIEAALALIEEVLSRQEEWARAAVLDISGRVGEERRTSGKATLMNIEEVRTALAIAREATAR